MLLLSRHIMPPKVDGYTLFLTAGACDEAINTLPGTESNVMPR